MPDIDGIKKFSKEELKQSRKIVLDSIDEVLKKESETVEAVPLKAKPLVQTETITRSKEKKAGGLFFLKKKPADKEQKKINDIVKTDFKRKQKSERIEADVRQIEVKKDKESVAPKVSDSDKALWQREMKNLLNQEEAAAEKPKPETETAPIIEKKTEEFRELKIAKVREGDGVMKSSINEQERKQFFSDISDISLLNKKPALAESPIVVAASPKNETIKEEAGPAKSIMQPAKTINEIKTPTKTRTWFSWLKKADKSPEKKVVTASLPKKQNPANLETHGEPAIKKTPDKKLKKFSIFGFWRKRQTDKKPPVKNLDNTPVVTTVAEKAIVPAKIEQPKETTKKPKKTKIKIDADRIHEEDEFGFSLATYKKFQENRKVEREEKIEKEEKAEKEEKKKANLEPKNNSIFHFFGRLKAAKTDKKSLKSHEFAAAAPDLVHDEIIGTKGTEKAVGFEKPAIKSLSLREKSRAALTRVADAWLDAKIYIIVGLVLFITAYSLLLVITLKVRIDTAVTRKISEYVPLPALISRNKIIEYYDYVDLQKGYCGGVCNLEQKKSFKVWLANRIIIIDLIDKYELGTKENPESQLERYIVFDNEINQVGINRIRKIKSLIDAEGDFYKNAEKFGDSFGQFNIKSIEGVIKDLNVDLDELDDKKTSRVIYGLDGYYLFFVDKALDPETVSYVFVTARSLEDYISERLDGYQIWSLVD